MPKQFYLTFKHTLTLKCMHLSVRFSTLPKDTSTDWMINQSTHLPID